jgi:hypothetical protein
VRLRKKSGTAEELKVVEEALRSAEGELEALAQAVATAEEAEHDLGDLGAEAALGRVDAGEFERRSTEVSERLVAARTRRDRQERVVDELRRRAVSARRAIEAEKAARADRDRDEEAAEVARLESALDAARVRLSEKEQQAALVRVGAQFAGREYDPELEAAAMAEERRYEDPVRWHAQRPEADERVPLELRERVEREREKMKQQAEAHNAALRQEAEESWRRAGLPPAEEPPTSDGGRFERLAPH